MFDQPCERRICKGKEIHAFFPQVHGSTIVIADDGQFWNSRFVEEECAPVFRWTTLVVSCTWESDYV